MAPFCSAVDTNMRQGARTDLGHPANLHNVTSQAEAAEKMSVSRRSLNSAKKVLSAGIPELVEAVEAGELPLFRAASIAQKSKAEQRARAEAGWRAPKAEPKPLGQRAQAQLDAVEAAWAKHVKEAWEGAGRQARTRFIKSLKG